MRLTVAILAGGLATRMHPLTERIPKSLIEVKGDYFICHQLRYLQHQGIKKVVLCVGHFGEQIEAAIGQGQAFGLDLHYSWDGENPLGTGGALKQALPLLGDTFFVLYGDSYLPIDFRAMEHYFYQRSNPALMAVFKNNNQWERSNVFFDKNLILEYNKYHLNLAMEYIDYGLSILSGIELEKFKANNCFDLAEFFHKVSLDQKLGGYEVFERFYEIGSQEGLQEAIKNLPVS
ncbi:MAG: NTP transferase domain-containing protein [Tatlockia sp.]|nr:NTP transferase domain-containing protein [Tatlockia sp.]